VRKLSLVVPLLGLLLASCTGGPGTIAAPPSPTPVAPSPTATPAPASLSGNAIRFTVAAGSEATVRVREQLASLPAPNDAVLTTSEVSGAFALLPDGTFEPSSKVTVDLRRLESDSDQRDRFIQENTLETSRFPTADFVPVSARGLALPLPSGEFAFTVDGRMTIHGITKDVSFAVTARREDGTVRAVASNSPAWTFGDFGMEQPRVLSVISIVDEIRLEVTLVATAA
jgi:polyisoprenoid-binding protein YceI